MISRFLPEDWWQAVCRPFAMAQPGSGVYVEVSAPDIRFAAAVALGLVLLVAAWRRGPRTARGGARGLFALALCTTVAVATWLATSGNGRYFVPYLILIGPLCMGLVHRLGATRAFRVAVLMLMVAVQFWLVTLNSYANRFDSWAWIGWKDAPVIAMETDPQVQTPDVLYITQSYQSYSMLAPLFPASARWINIAQFHGVDATAPPANYRPVTELLARAPAIRLLYPAERQGAEPLDETVVAAVDEELRRHGLKVRSAAACRFVESSTLAAAVKPLALDGGAARTQRPSTSGFWLCDLQYAASLIHRFKQEQEAGAVSRARSVFEAIERQCPLEAPPGQYAVDTYGKAFARRYAGSDAMLTYDGKAVHLHHATLLNPRQVAAVEGPRVPRVDCRLLLPRLPAQP